MTCKDCAKSHGEVFETNGRQRVCCWRDAKYPYWEWADGSCPDFEARKDWAEELTEKLFNHTTEFWKRDNVAELIRQAAKAHYEGGKP